MTRDLNRGDQGWRALPWGRFTAAVLLLPLLALAACGDTLNYARDGHAINLRDCSDWGTQSIPGCYDGQGGRN